MLLLLLALSCAPPQTLECGSITDPNGFSGWGGVVPDEYTVFDDPYAGRYVITDAALTVEAHHDQDQVDPVEYGLRSSETSGIDPGRQFILMDLDPAWRMDSCSATIQ